MSSPKKDYIGAVSTCVGERGFRNERDVLAVMQAAGRVVRSFENAVCDGAIDCSRNFKPSSSFVTRFFECVESRKNPEDAGHLIPFDVKSNADLCADGQTYYASNIQHRVVAFWIFVSMADPSFVEVVPNTRQTAQEDWNLFERGQDDQELGLILPNASVYVHSAAYVLNPTGSPYRLPLALLNVAVDRIYQSHRDDCDYTNPWTEVRFRGWRPRTTRSTSFMAPAETSQLYSSYKEIQDLIRIVNYARVPGTHSCRLEFVSSAPLLGDIRFVCNGQDYIIQHKLHYAVLPVDEALRNLPVARRNPRGNNKIKYYFRGSERFDFFMYQIVSDEIDEFLFFPERVIDDDFYTSAAMTRDFTEAPFNHKLANEEYAYRFRKDSGGLWLHRVIDIVRMHTEPRRVVPRPDREAVVSMNRRKAEKKGNFAGESSAQRAGSRTAFKEANIKALDECWNKIMEQCAVRKSGLLLVLPSNHPMGDFVFSRYRWSQDEQAAFLDQGSIPTTIDHLPPWLPAVGLCYLTREAHADFFGPPITGKVFSRLDSTPKDRLVLFDLSADGARKARPLYIVPSQDIRATDLQRATLSANLEPRRGRPSKTPVLAHLLSTGTWLGDYQVCNGGASLYEQGDMAWGEIWSFLDHCTGFEEFEHPIGITRSPMSLQHSLKSVLEMSLDCSMPQFSA